MSCLSNTFTNRRFVLFFARLLVQCVAGSSISQTGMDEMRCFHAPYITSGKPVARNEQELTVFGFDNIAARRWKLSGVDQRC